MNDQVASPDLLDVAGRLRRLSERLQRDADGIYRDLGLPFEARWFRLFRELDRGGPLAVTDLAGRLGVTHPAVSQLAAELLARGLLRRLRDPGDGRRRLLALSPRGRRLRASLEPAWGEIGRASDGLLAEAGGSLLAGIGALERLLDRRDLRQRVRARLKQRLLDHVEIVPYRPRYRCHFKALNMEWLGKYFTAEPRDLAVLDDPGRRIIGRGGRVLFARLDGRIIGTCAIVPEGNGDFELVKMAVHPAHRGAQAGRKLALAAIAEARLLGGGRLIARTSNRLKAAVGLYRSLGFADEGADRSGQYRRPTIVLALDLKRRPDASSRGDPPRYPPGRNGAGPKCLDKSRRNGIK